MFAEPTGSSFEHVEPAGEKLVHLTANRAKGPTKRPPSQVFVQNVRYIFSFSSLWSSQHFGFSFGCCNRMVWKGLYWLRKAKHEGFVIFLSIFPEF